MSAEVRAEVSLIDHHCHGVVPISLSAASFEGLMSESFARAPSGTSHWDKPIALAIRRWCAPVLDLSPFCSPQAYVERRGDLGAEEVNRRFLGAAGLEMLLVDSGNKPEELCSVAALGELAGVPSYEVVRMESVAEAVARNGVAAEGFADALEDALENASSGRVVGLKSIVAYRSTLAIDYTHPSPAEVVKAASKWLAEIERTGKARMTDAVLERHLIWTGADLARQKGFPIQFHIGIGDPDIELNKVDPSHLTPFFRAVEPWHVNFTLLHCYPFHREAGLISENFPHVYFDVGFGLNWAGASYARIIEEALEIAPFTKQLYSSDAFGLAELYYLGALRFRAGMKRTLDRWVSEGECPATEAERIIALIARDNARRIYPIDGEPAQTISASAADAPIPGTS